MKYIRNLSLLAVALVLAAPISAQENSSKMQPLPYYEIPDAPSDYHGAAVAARMVDGLGFRYYWATEGLRVEDLTYKPSDEGRTTRETLDHIYGLSRTIANTCKGQVNERTDRVEMSFDELRAATLRNFEEASLQLRSADANLGEMLIVFVRGENRTEYPFWNLINGPIADALWHCGQVVSFRRASGNPFNSKVSVFTGKVRE